MGMPVLKISVPNSQDVNLLLDGMVKGISDWRGPIWNSTVNRGIRPIVKEQFETTGAVGPHGEWAPLSPKYAKRKAKKFPNAPVLVATGQMRDALLSPENMGDQQPMSMTFGGPRPSIFHQMGTSRPMPSRRIIDIGPSQQNRILKAFQFGLRTVVYRTGFGIGGRGISPSEALQIGTTRLKGF